MQLQKSFFFLSPVEVVKVTSSNLQEVAEWCGGQVAETESRRVPGRMDSYVWVPTPKGTSISWAFPGMFITKRLVRTVKDEIRVTFAVFRKDYFDKNYFDSPNQAVDETWERHDKQQKAAAKQTPKPTAPKNHLKGTSMEEYVPAANSEEEVLKLEEESKDVSLPNSSTDHLTGKSREIAEQITTVSESRRGVTVAPAEEPTADGIDVVAETPAEDEPDVDFRSAESGQFVTEEFAAEHPETTVAEVNEVADKDSE